MNNKGTYYCVICGTKCELVLRPNENPFCSTICAEEYIEIIKQTEEEIIHCSTDKVVHHLPIVDQQPAKTILVTQPLRGIATHEVGPKPVDICTYLTKDQLQDLQVMAQNRVFIFGNIVWDRDSGKADIKLIPGNGVIWIMEAPPSPLRDVEQNEETDPNWDTPLQNVSRQVGEYILTSRQTCNMCGDPIKSPFSSIGYCSSKCWSEHQSVKDSVSTILEK